ncbi:hypothetical protein UFOVP26_123 [uncultured Caudovirales phage]|uniref:Uncharacterized protein n=1 Tax=uncultured Caudovirales phage TaxID=2100421 RepID=A0A6J5KLP2_9CAUD|nr:hypothetical protein UFOVP26_123 [uncultured Caudovirales phage]CAB4123986.1 hypothetical protein UFOVP44_112 [uncultured Caudovirales phage]CAB5219579.1 hypothetical protein UFOVP220_103 [uncultured Caudovirales phage]
MSEELKIFAGVIIAVFIIMIGPLIYEASIQKDCRIAALNAGKSAEEIQAICK